MICGVISIDKRYFENIEDISSVFNNLKLIRKIVSDRNLYIITNLENVEIFSNIEGIISENIIRVDSINQYEEFVSIACTYIEEKFKGSKVCVIPGQLNINGADNIKKFIVKYMKVLDINQRAKMFFAGEEKINNSNGYIYINNIEKVKKNSSTFYKVIDMKKENYNERALINYGVVLGKSAVLKVVENINDISECYVVPVAI